MDVQDARALPAENPLEVDVCIIGSGPAGLTIASELAGSGRQVLVLESGGLERSAWSDALSSIESVGAPRTMDSRLVMNRVLGGTTDTWSGRVATFDEVDFAVRSWVPASGWPIVREELRPYFARSSAYLGNAVPDNNDYGVAERLVTSFPDFDGSLFASYAWTFSRHLMNHREPVRYGLKAREFRLPGVRCLLHATATHIDTNPGATRVEGVQVTSPDGLVRRIRTPRLVLAAGAIENARLLLASNSVATAGLANRNGLVGRFLMDHPRGPVATFDAKDFYKVQRVFGDYRFRSARGVTRVVPGLALSSRLQRDEELLNCALWVSGEISPDDPILGLRNLLRRRRPAGGIRAVLSRPDVTTEGLKRILVDRRAALRKMSSMVLQCIVEQRPDPESRITLSETRDALGVPRPVLDWKISEQEAATVRRACALFVSEMSRIGLPVPTRSEMISDTSEPFYLPDVAHPTGTTRMSADPRLGVVDQNCEAHDVGGLYISGSSVFPTSGHANPTQMIVALAIRLADYLKCETGTVQQSVVDE